MGQGESLSVRVMDRIDHDHGRAILDDSLAGMDYDKRGGWGAPRMPKIIAATATISAPERQLETLYQRIPLRFPYPGPDLYHSFFAEPAAPPSEIMLNIVPDASDEDEVVLETTARLTRSGRVLRMIQEDGRLLRPTADLTLVRLIIKARNWWQRLQLEQGLTLSAIAEQEGVGHSYVTRILRLAFLSPRVVQAITSCRQPMWMDGGALSASGAIALDWEDQNRQLLLDRAI